MWVLEWGGYIFLDLKKWVWGFLILVFDRKWGVDFYIKRGLTKS